MQKKTQLITQNYYKNEAKIAYIVAPLLVLVLASLVASVFTLRDLPWESHVSTKRGLLLFISGLVFFPALFLALNNMLIHTLTGKKFIKAYKLSWSDIYDISNKCVSAVQALFCCLTGITCIKYSCSRDILRTSHYVSEAYAWFGAAYFFYDIWSMYKVYSSKVTQPNLNGIKDQIVLKVCRFTAYVVNNFIIVAHHIFIGCFGFLVITHLRGGLGDCFFGFIYLMEASTPFVSLRGILSKIGMKNSRWYIVNGLVMLATFFIFRVAMFPYVIHLFAESLQVTFVAAVKRLPKNCIISICILLFPQIYWFCLMLKGATQILFINKEANGVLKQPSNANNNVWKSKKTKEKISTD